jgi:hypothetical protein
LQPHAHFRAGAGADSLPEPRAQLPSGASVASQEKQKEDGMPVHPEVEFWLKVVGGIGVLIALTLTWRTHTERATFDMIDRLYTLCHALETHALRNWYLAHLFCVGAKEYESVKEHVKELAAREPQRVPEFIVKEKLFAIHVFISYEQVFYQWKNTSPVLHRRRRRFLSYPILLND